MAFSQSKLIVMVAVAFFLWQIYNIYTLLFMKECVGGIQKCVIPHQTKENLIKNYRLSVFISRSAKSLQKSNSFVLYQNVSMRLDEGLSVDLKADLPSDVYINSSLYAHAVLHPAETSPFSSADTVSSASLLITKFLVPRQSFNLLTQFNTEKTSTVMAHHSTYLVVYYLLEEHRLPRYSIPQDIYRLMSFTNNGNYKPVVYIDSLSILQKHLQVVNASEKVLPVQLSYSSVWIGKLRLWSSIELSLVSMRQLGFNDEDLDEVRGIFTDTNFYFLGLTFFVSFIHLLFDFLAFKNDISFWKNRDNMEGISSRGVAFRCLSTIIIFLFLLDSKTSLLVLIPMGVSSVIEMWKVMKALKFSLHFQGLRPCYKFGDKTTSEKQTNDFDSQAMTYLSYLLYPLLVLGALYSLVYYPQKSWWSWVLNSAVNAVYAFGFLFMLPQLFVNYKLKTVAHLPWRSFMYKAFNTFIDDVFAFIITMPTAHRLACFRDDLIFLVYLYQRWLYPVDHTRTNEFGQSFDAKKEE